MQAVWNKVKKDISNTSGDEFERMVLHYLRAVWPALVQSPRLQHLDRLGVDLCVPSDEDGVFEVVIQVKGFKADEKLLKSQVAGQIIPSVEKFRASKLKCSLYILLHNRDGSDRELASEIEEALKGLVTQGKAQEARLIDRDGIITLVRDGMSKLIKSKLDDKSQLLQKEKDNIFHFGNLFIQHVPLAKHEWKPSISFRPEFTNISFVDTDVARLISSTKKTRYSIMIGSFGIGKTTMALRAASIKDHHVIYVRAYTVESHYKGGQGTHIFLRNLNEELNLLEDFPPETASALDILIGPTLGRILRQIQSEYVLVLDGIDENFFYSTPHGLQLLTNELAELRCPIILTTRKEHFLSLMGNYEIAVEKLTKDGGINRKVEILELGTWTLRQANELLQSAEENATDEEQKKKIRQLYEKINSSTQEHYLELLRHPLFLQMTLDLIMDGVDEIIEQKKALIELWMRQKIKRDFKSPRFDFEKILDVDAYLEGMIDAMAHIAFEMSAFDGDKRVLLDSINAEDATRIVRRHIGIPDLDIATILNSSLLVPLNRRKGKEFNVKFFHRAIQEYFLERSDSDMNI